VINGQQRLDRSTFDTSLAPYLNSSSVLVGVADNTMLGISTNDLTSTHVDISCSGGSSGRRSGDRHPLIKFFFNFFSVETKKEEFWRLENALKTVF
jgi:hypothetical protein